MQLIGFWFQSSFKRIISDPVFLTAGLKPRLRSWKAVALLMLLIMPFTLPGIINPGKASAVCGNTEGVPSDTLTIKIGYFGGPYYTKKIYTLSDFDKLTQVEQAYTFIDSMNAVIIDSAQGVKLADLLVDAGVDINSIQKFYFFSTDIKRGWYQCLDKSSLMDTPRYYYPNLPSHWDYENLSAMPEAESGAVRVEPIIAYKDNWRRYVDAPDFSNYDTSTRFRLLFGQKDTFEHNAPQSAKWVHAIEIMLGGKPPAGVTLDQDIVNTKVGSKFKLTANVAPDEATDKSVIWSSSDSSVATVDENGLVTVVGKGTATITVSTIVANFTAACVVNGPNQNDGGAGIVSANTNPPNDGIPKNEASVSDAAQKYLAGREVTTADIRTDQTSLEDSGQQPWRVIEMSVDAVPLQQQKKKNILNIYASVICLVLFLSGAGKRYQEYTRDIM